jgi:two-component system response regulator AgrA
MNELHMDVVLSTSDPSKIIEMIENTTVHGLYFLDVELNGGYNGVNIAKTIRKYDPRGFIVFITAHSQYMSLTFEYKVEALAYIKKTYDREMGVIICECINNAYDKHVSRSDEGCFVFRTICGRKYSYGYEDILFFESQAPSGSKRIVAHMKKRQYVFSGTIKNVMKRLPFGLFFQCHQSYIVNIRQLSDTNIIYLNEGGDRLIMPDGSVCYVSMRNRTGLIKMLEATRAGHK